MSNPEITLDLGRVVRRHEGGGDVVVTLLGTVSVGGVSGDLVYFGRDACMRTDHGVVPLDKEVYNPALAEQVDRLAGAIWGDDWSRVLAELAGINRRTTARDRIRKFGLPPGLLMGLIKLSRRDDAREVAGVARAVARYWDVHKKAPPEAPLKGMIELLRDFRGYDEFLEWMNVLRGDDPIPPHE